MNIISRRSLCLRHKANRLPITETGSLLLHHIVVLEFNIFDIHDDLIGLFTACYQLDYRSMGLVMYTSSDD